MNIFHRKKSMTILGSFISNVMVRRCRRQFNEGRTNVHDGDQSGRPSLITDELVSQIDEKFQPMAR